MLTLEEARGLRPGTRVWMQCRGVREPPGRNDEVTVLLVTESHIEVADIAWNKPRAWKPWNGYNISWRLWRTREEWQENPGEQWEEYPARPPPGNS